MRVRDHIALSTAGAALAQPWLGNRALGFWVGGVLVDVDHYLWFCARERRLSPRAAIRFFNAAHPPQHARTRAFHNPAVPLTLLLLGTRRRALLPVGAGMLVHLTLDLQHRLRMANARLEALERDRFVCRACGARDSLDAHLHTQPRLLPSYRPENLVALCAPCHEAAHEAVTSWN